MYKKTTHGSKIPTAKALLVVIKRQKIQHRAFYSQVGAAVSGISHVLTGRVMEFIMETQEKLNTDYGQPPPPAECLQWEQCCPAPSSSPGAWFADAESWAMMGTPTTQSYRGGGSHLLPISLGSCPPLKSWAVGIRSVPGSTEHPAWGQ